MYTLNNLKEIKEEYYLEHVNCVEKVIDIILDSYNKDYRSLFLLFLKMMECYKFECYDQKKINAHPMTKIQYLLEKEFRIKLYSERVDDIHTFINKQIEKNNPIVVPGNLKELYYSKFYNKDNWPHFFIIKGVDIDNKLYQTLDSTQRDDNLDQNYYYFVIPLDILENMYYSYNEKIGLQGIYYFNSKEINTKVDHKEILNRCLDIFIDKRVQQPYMEIDIVNKLISEKELNHELIDYLKKISNYKHVFCNELYIALSRYIHDSNYLSKIENDIFHFEENSSKIINKIVYFLLKHDKKKINEEVNKYIEAEERFVKKVVEFRTQIRKKQMNNELNSDLFENNRDNIIIQNNDNFLFNFNNNKIYNNWFSDESPKVVFKNLKEEINFTVRINLISNEETAEFLAGIFIRTNEGELYNWGVNCGASLRLEKSGVDNNIFDIPECSNSVLLRIIYKNNRCRFFYKIDCRDEKLKEIERYIDIDSNIKDFGIACKTWGRFVPIKIEIKCNDINI